ncbi:GNAT family N-acetyltransferase [Cedecea neteri]|uniref:GNAT family N-acetyltransferase n=1 Tax=Cedecea neteri TaxID=158822 RepID=UPI002AA82DDA|nr:GNAT family N-acetyltransferase [Cedecea neteri]WPU24867.1 GNAT family N-acetyltransferase [Cedecea neteri]
MELTFTCNSASRDKLSQHLKECDLAFSAPLSERVDIISYAQKLHENAICFEAWQGEVLVGLVGIYCQPASEMAFISNVSVLPAHHRQGIGGILLEKSIGYARQQGVLSVKLEVAAKSQSAIALYTKYGFSSEKTTEEITTMLLIIQESCR